MLSLLLFLIFYCRLNFSDITVKLVVGNLLILLCHCHFPKSFCGFNEPFAEFDIKHAAGSVVFICAWHKWSY